MSVSIIIPCYILPDKNAELLTFTQDCVNSMRAFSPYVEIVIIDNGSPVFKSALRAMSDVYFRFPENCGFAPAVNQGLKIANGEWLVVANNDVTFVHDWPGHAIGCWSKNTGIISSHLQDHDPEHKAPIKPYPWGHFFGALWMVKKSMLSEIGYLDEQFELGYYEDKDYVRRIVQTFKYDHVKAGWCNHIGNATSGKMANLSEFFFANKKRFEDKWQRQQQHNLF